MQLFLFSLLTNSFLLVRLENKLHLFLLECPEIAYLYT
jgi:hypothetical protein